MKRILMIVVLLLMVIVKQYATNIKTWYPENHGFRTTKTETYSFQGSKGDVLKCRIKGAIMAGSYVNIYLDGIKIMSQSSSDFEIDATSSSHELSEDKMYSIKYEYYYYCPLNTHVPSQPLEI